MTLASLSNQKQVIYCISAAVVLLKTVLTLLPVNSQARGSANAHIIGRERFKHTLIRSLPAHDLSVTPRAIAFYIVGLRKILNTLSMMLAESLMMIVANIVPDFLMGILTGARTQGVMMIFEVFFRLPDHLPKPLRRYDPLHCTPLHKHANQGFYKKYFEGLAFRNTLAGGPPTIAGTVVLYRRRFWGTVKLIERLNQSSKLLLLLLQDNRDKSQGIPLPQIITISEFGLR
ncbi:hypothetical protein OIU74_005379 [Salix koriyanagi]|uniref:Uncharacterized protein n=1 Tax=Salix koriyanagi TaxID=2511006 RepID=A0A9Q0ZGE0_9ROSI|nr:hypothetical protein OIU74_005379 [Salix koriyanagi]